MALLSFMGDLLPLQLMTNRQNNMRVNFPLSYQWYNGTSDKMGGLFFFLLVLFFLTARGALILTGGITMTDNQFQKKFDQMRPALLLDLRASATSFDHEQIMTAFAIHLQEISPMHNCPRWQIIKAARGWSVFLKNFISDEKKLGTRFICPTRER